MAKGRIGLGFSINNFPVSYKFDARVNIREDFNFLRYGSSFGGKNVGISYLNSKPINVLENIMIKDRTASVSENSPFTYSEDIKTEQEFSLHNAKFLISDVFKTNSHNETFPLYFFHDLSQYHNIEDVVILDSDFNEINLDLYSFIDESQTLGYERRGVYTNLKSEYDSILNTYTIYYIRFKNLDTHKFVTELLNAKPFYKKATFATAPTDRVYSVTPENGNAQVKIFFNSMAYSPTPIPNSHRFAIKMHGDNRISVDYPANLPPTEKWYLRITPGEFYRNTSAGRIRYSVPEYEHQLFSPVLPYRLLIEKTAAVINSRVIHVEPKPVANLEIPGFFIYIALRDKYGHTTRALTNDPDASVYMTPNGVVTEIFYETDAIESVSEVDGFIRLNTDIDVDAEVFVTYRYSEYSYTYRGISVNSTINPDILNNRIIVYCKPEISGGLSKTIFHLLVDENDLIIDANESDSFISTTYEADGGSDTTLIDQDLFSQDCYTGEEIEFLTGVNAGRKIKIAGYDSASKTLTFSTSLLVPIEAKDKYRINRRSGDYEWYDAISGMTFSYQGWINKYTDHPYFYILLADVFAVQTVAPKDISKSDIRIRGGGIKESEIDNALKSQDEVQWYWDIGYWDGQPYPGMGAMLIELPRKILKEVGGNFSRKQVKEIVEKHIGHGVYPIIKYYDKSTNIIAVVPKNQAIEVKWRDVKASSYNIYIGQNPDQLKLHRTVAGIVLEDEITGLENNKVYYVMIEAYVGGIPQLPSRKAFAIPFDATAIKSPAIYGQTIYQEGSYSHG